MVVSIGQIEEVANSTWKVTINQRAKGQSGQNVRQGLIYVDKNPNVAPLVLRGRNRVVGEAQQLANHHIVGSEAELRASTLGAARWTIAPSMRLKGVEEIPSIAKRQFDFCERLWNRWKLPITGDERTLHSWIAEVVVSYLKTGLWLGELLWDVEEDFVYPRLPYYRGPQSIESWIFQGDFLKGVILNPPRGQNLYEYQAETDSIIIGADELLLISRFRAGIGVEGNIFHRTALQLIKHQWAQQESDVSSAASRAINGELLFVPEPNDPVSSSKEDLDSQKIYLEDRASGKSVGCIVARGYKPHHIPCATINNVEPINTLDKQIAKAIGADYRGIDGGQYRVRSSAQEGQGGYSEYEALDCVVGPLRDLFTRAIIANNLHEGDRDNLFVPEIEDTPIPTTSSVQQIGQAFASLVGAGVMFTDQEKRQLASFMMKAIGGIER